MLPSGLASLTQTVAQRLPVAIAGGQMTKPATGNLAARMCNREDNKHQSEVVPGMGMEMEAAAVWTRAAHRSMATELADPAGVNLLTRRNPLQ